MKILLLSHRFHPSVGGTEEVGQILAEEWSSIGHEVRVVTQTESTLPNGSAFEVIRRPARQSFLELVRWSDVFFQNNISLRTAWPMLAVRRPFVIAHHTWITRPDGKIGWQDRLKRSVSRRAINIAVSAAIADSIGAPATIVGNPFRNGMFRIVDAGPRDRELIFVGRLVSDKGIDLLIDALAILARSGIKPRLTIVGGGPDEGALRDQCKRQGLDEQVRFVGVLRGDDLVRMLNQHRCIVVPSRWEEPFGLVALEGAACGCRPIVARSGALPEAAGPGAVLFKRGNADDLAAKLGAALQEGATPWRPSAEHLARHQARTVAMRYLEVFEAART